MEEERKKLLIVDDTEIDRITLKSILCRDFDVLEAQSGSMACEYIAAQGSKLSAILLDISMPEVDGFDVLRFIEEKHMDDIPVFLVTSEPTVDNVQRAMRYHIAEFIRKPFQREDVLRRLQTWLYMTLEPELRPEELKTTLAYISDLKEVYKAYLANHGRNDAHCRIMSDLMRILLTAYNKSQREHRLNKVGIELVCRAAYFCDVGEMLLPGQELQSVVGEARYQELWQSHPILGSKLIRLNRAKSCEYFVEICSGMCLCHHERFDGQGYPNRLREQDISIYNQMCRLVDEFETVRGGAYDEKGRTISHVIKRLADGNSGMVSPGLCSLLKSCESQIMDYFKKMYQGA